MINKENMYNNLYTADERKELISQSLKTYRLMNKATQAEIAQAIGINVQTYAAYERGRNEPPAEVIIRLSHLYEIPTDIILQRDNLSKDTMTAKKQLEQYESILDEAAENLIKGDKNSIREFQELVSGIEKLGDLIKDFKKITTENKK